MAAGGGNKLNPFQIEDVDLDDDRWEGDFYDDDDDDDDFMAKNDEAKEVRGLLMSNSGPSSTASNPKPAVRRMRTKRSSSSSYPVGRTLAVLAITSLFLWIVLSISRNADESLSSSGSIVDPISNKTLSPAAAAVRSPVSAPTTPVVPAATATTTTTSPPPTIQPTYDKDPADGTDETTIHTEHDDFVPSERIPKDAVIMPDDDDDWNDDKNGGKKPIRPPDTTPKPLFFIVLGERHSGVDYILNVLQHCYGDEHRYGSGYTRGAEWFQTYDPVDVSFRMDSTMHYRVVLILATRNVYDWVQDMYRKPLYMGGDLHDDDDDDTTPLLLKDFLRAPWSSSIPNNTTNGFCQFNFLPRQVSPCLQFPDAYRFSNTTPVYELNNATGMPYQHILDFRAAKIRHWMVDLVQSWGMEPMVLPMDATTAWTTEFANQLHNRTAGQELCRPNATTTTTTYQVESYSNMSSSMSTKFMEWMNANVDWEMESKIGYAMRQQPLQR